MTDLAAGVPLSDIPDGGLLAGTVGEASVMLARWTDDTGAEQVTALDATCTHAGADLTTGLRTGVLVRCPFHHACFDLRSGEAVRHPAYEPLRRWPVTVTAGRAVVAGEPVAAEPEQVPNTRGVRDVVVVGGGAAGFACVEKLRRAGYDGTLTMFTTEPQPPLDRTKLSKAYLTGDAGPDGLPLQPADWYEAHDVALHLSTEVTAVDTTARTVSWDGGTLPYDALVLATGAEPVRPDLPGFEHALVLRTKADADALLADAGKLARVAVVGSSFIGLEVAAALRQKDVPVTVVGLEEVPLAGVLGSELGRLVQDLHADQGVELLVGKVASWAAGGLHLEDGRTVQADVLVIGMGVKPRTALAEAAGLAVDDGVVVDVFGETEVPGVFAAGDVARFPWDGRWVRVEHWAVAGRAGALAAVNLLGAEQPLDEPPYFWSKHYGTNIRFAGHAESVEQASVEAGPLVRITEDGRVTAVVGVKSDLRVLQLEDDLLRP